MKAVVRNSALRGTVTRRLGVHLNYQLYTDVRCGEVTDRLQFEDNIGDGRSGDLLTLIAMDGE